MSKKAVSTKQTSSAKKVITAHQEISGEASTVLSGSPSGRKRTTSIPNLLKNRPFYIKFF